MGVMRARESFCWWDANGTPHDVPAGTLIDPERTNCYEGREHLFEDAEVYVDQQEVKKAGYKPETRSTVESATAAPGEKRSLTSPATTPPNKYARKDGPKNG